MDTFSIKTFTLIVYEDKYVYVNWLIPHVSEEFKF